MTQPLPLRPQLAHTNGLGSASAAGCPTPHAKFITIFRSPRGPSRGASRDTLEKSLPSSRTREEGKEPSKRKGQMGLGDRLHSPHHHLKLSREFVYR